VASRESSACANAATVSGYAPQTSAARLGQHGDSARPARIKVTPLVYCDSSVLLKRVLDESDSNNYEQLLSELIDQGATLISSELALIEVRRALGRGAKGTDLAEDSDKSLEEIFADVGLVKINEDVVNVAGRLPGRHLGSLDAIHLATALLSESTIVLTGDIQMRSACREIGLVVA
jgi:predicted nucleic acid-binding protein